MPAYTPGAADIVDIPVADSVPEFPADVRLLPVRSGIPRFQASRVQGAHIPVFPARAYPLRKKAMASVAP